MNGHYERREVLKFASGILLGGALSGVEHSASAKGGLPAERRGRVVGQLQAAKVGEDVLTSGGNAVDAAVAAALVAGVVAVQQCGIGGYGGHMVIALASGKRITAIDFNSTAPASARDTMFSSDEKGQVRGQANVHGWLAAGVPGTLAGLQLALDHYGTMPFRTLVQPAIRYAREGFPVTISLANALRGARAQLEKDPASARLLLDQSRPLQQGSTFRNPDLATLLQTLADRNSVDSFYRGDIARRIAAEFRMHGGLVTAQDLAAYHAREVKPLEFRWNGYSIYTAPLTAGGLSVLEALGILKALGWETRPAKEPRTMHARIEALRIAWGDRLKFLGDPEQVDVPIRHLLSEPYARQMAARVDTAVREGKALPTETDERTASGTVHLSTVDAQGTLVALTLTHGGAFGAQVTVDGLGLILGHGMSRFDPRPGRPNSPGPGKRPLHNMCPTIVTREGKPILALGGVGGRKIPNAIFDVLAHYAGRNFPMEQAIAVPRLHTEGGMAVTLEPAWPESDKAYLRNIGYTVKNGPSAVIHAVSFDPESGVCRAASR